MTNNRGYANRGKKLEKLIDDSNDRYRDFGKGDIRKIPTPTKILKHMGNKFVGHTEKGEWVDFVGKIQGGTVIFDAKQTSSKTSFDLKNIPEHQYEILESWSVLGAQSFILVHFTELDRYFRLPFIALDEYWWRMLDGGRKSITLKEFEEKSTEVFVKLTYLDYLEGLY